MPGRIPGGSTAVVGSPDGRYAGWVDREGPWTIAGRIAEVVVVDLQTGRAVFRDHENMGGAWGDELPVLYGELEPRFVGFDDEGRAYWQDAAGHGERWRVDLDPGKRRTSRATTPPGATRARSATPTTRASASRCRCAADAVVDPLLGVATGSLSPDGRFVLGSVYRQRLQVTVAGTGRRRPPRPRASQRVLRRLARRREVALRTRHGRLPEDAGHRRTRGREPGDAGGVPAALGTLHRPARSRPAPVVHVRRGRLPARSEGESCRPAPARS